MSTKNFLDSFESLGVTIHGDSGDGRNYVADCPFSGREGKLYFRIDNGLWDSKVANLSGNLYTFIQEFYDKMLKETTLDDLNPLARNRKLPVEAFYGKIAYNYLNSTYIHPEYSPEGVLASITSFNTRTKTQRILVNTKTQLNGIHKITSGDTVYICEGQWDYLAVSYMLEKIGSDSKAVCVPGAGTFKKGWEEFFYGCNVILCYDNDEPGQLGKVKVARRLSGIVQAMQEVVWPSSFKKGYDMRDFIIQATKGSDSASSFRKTMKILETKLLQETKEEEARGPEEPDDPEGEGLPDGVNAEKMEEIVQKWIKLDSTIPLDILYGTIFANRIDGDPVWMFLIAPPGGSKTELLMTLNRSEWVETTTTLTAASLVSGIKFPEGDDPSLLIKVNGRNLVIKDFTTILSMQAQARDEVFGILRDVYDGYVEKFFGTGVKKSYKSKFGMLAGVTPMIDAVSSQQTSLGERFLKFRLNRWEKGISSEEKIRKALANVDSESDMRMEMQIYAKALLRKKMPENLPSLSEEQTTQIMKLAMLVALLRGSVPKDPYTNVMLCMPIQESGTRLAKQFAKLAIGISCYRSDGNVSDRTMEIIRTVAEDTCPDRYAVLVQALFRAKDPITVKELCSKVNMSDATVRRLLDDFILLGIATAQQAGRLGWEYSLSKEVTSLINETGMWQ